MTIQNEALTIIELGFKEVENLEIELKKIGSLSDSDRELIHTELRSAFTALYNAKCSIQNSEMKHFMMSYTEAILKIGRAYGRGAQAKVFSKLKSQYVKKKLSTDIKQQEKKVVYELWLDWQDNPGKYKNKTKFSISMIEKFRPDNPEDEEKHLSSPKVIADWCSSWSKGEGLPEI